MRFQSILLNVALIVMFTNSGYAQRWFVDANVTSLTMDGQTWETAFSDLEDALSIASFGDSILVAKGTYYPNQQWDDLTGEKITSDSELVSFRIHDGLHVLGSFVGDEDEFSKAILESRDFINNASILNGDVGDVGVMEDNARHVVYVRDVSNQTVLDGFIIENGYALGAGVKSYGGGVYHVGYDSLAPSSPIINNCMFQDNIAWFGGGIYSFGTTDVHVSHCNFQGNESKRGAGVFCWVADQEPKLTIDSCEFTNNTADDRGAGVSLWTDGAVGTLAINGCLFSSNSSRRGAALSVDLSRGQGAVRVENTKFEDNSSTDVGGAIEMRSFSGNDDYLFESCQFVNNESDYFGGAIIMSRNNGKCQAEFNNCLFEENEARESGGAIYIDEVTTKILNTVFDFNIATYFYGGAIYIETNASSFLDLKSCTFYKNISVTGGGGVYNDGSAFISNCIFWQNFGSNKNSWSNERNSIGTNVSHTLVGESSEGDFDTLTKFLGGMLLNQDPLFADSEDNDWRLLDFSPAIDAGNNDSISGIVQYDIEGNPRIQGSSVDMGAYETEGVITAFGASGKDPNLVVSWFPNPVIGKCTVDCAEAVENPIIQLYDLRGVMLFSESHQSGDRFELDFQMQPSGEFLLVLIEGGRMTSTKIFKK